MNYCGLMFHHLHDDQTPENEVIQGSVHLEVLDDIIRDVKKKYSLLNADEFAYRANQNKLKSDEICLTFDDSLKSQYSIARQILNNYNLNAFYFVYTGIYSDKLPLLEIYRLFRNKYFESFDEYYNKFIALFREQTQTDWVGLLKSYPENYLEQFPFYSRNEKIFRYIRDVVLKDEEYIRINNLLIEEYTTIYDLAKNLWFTEEEIKNLHDDGHQIGLHSTNHQTNLGELSDQVQQEEYFNNKSFLENIIGRNITSIGYPSGSYNRYTLELMKQIGVEVGFLSYEVEKCQSKMEIPRIDCTNYLNLMFGK
ncbi:MAG: polysaccharide deacetylase family protein [Bacteroidales bacterium]|nr:polysaccharide deacetylase family protein [Bacteroidales bacterium]